MTFWEMAGIILGAAGLFASILGVLLAYAARANGQATRALIREMQAETRELIESMEGRLTGVLERMDGRWREAWERMDQRADERHHEIVQLIQTLRPPSPAS